MNRVLPLALVGGLAVLAVATGCQKAIPQGALVLTQTPTNAYASTAGDLLDARYPPGSRVVLATPPFNPKNVRVLSQGLAAAGSPLVSIDGTRIFFVGKASLSSSWQVYENRLGGGRPKAVTHVESGAMDPALLPSGELVFASPVPKRGAAATAETRPSIYARSLAGGAARRLTFASQPCVEPTVLFDGRILFVAEQPGTNMPPHPGLFTINNDGTEITAFAGQHDSASVIHRPRQLPDGRVAFVSAETALPTGEGVAECVRMARPFLSRARVFASLSARCRSIEPGPNGAVLASLESRGLAGRSRPGTYAIFKLDSSASNLGEPLFDDLTRDDLEATLVMPRAKPQGRISAMVPTRKSGTILCLDVNRSSYLAADGTVPAAARVRVVAAGKGEQPRVLGEVPLCADGSFMAEVPADIPLGFDALDATGNVLRRVPPFIYVRSGENRTCIGCHEPHNRTPHNVRPAAVQSPPAQLCAPPSGVVRKSS